MKEFGIVVTTIYDGAFLLDYAEHFRQHGDLNRVRFYVVADLKTPAICQQAAEKARAAGMDVVYLSPDDQKEFLKPFPEMEREIPWNTDGRRNVGFLMAYRDKCPLILATDDDNYPKPEWRLLEGHATTGRNLSLPTAVGHKGWFNLCSMMDIECPPLGAGKTVFARGFPYKRRSFECSTVSSTPTNGRVAVNAGLWSGDPDVDAATRLVTRCEARENFKDSYLLAPDTIMPINTQNTVVIRDAIPAYYYVKMGHPVGGMKLDRFGDIFSGFFLQKCVQAVGDRVRVGSPVVDHRRSPHNLYKDLWNELAGMVVIDDMLPVLEASPKSAPDYSAATLALAEQLEKWSADQSGFLWDNALKDYFRNVTANMRLWVKVCAQLE